MPDYLRCREDCPRRPNGIAVLGDIVYVVDRDRRNVLVARFTDDDHSADETWVVLDAFGKDALQMPYGIAARSVKGEQLHRVWITDSHQTDPNRHRILMYDIEFDQIGGTDVTFMDAFGDPRGSGMIRKAESLAVSPDGRRMLVADEHEEERNIKLYNPESGLFEVHYGSQYFAGVILVGFTGEPEGIATYQLTERNWFWVCADQTYDPLTNSFRVYDGTTLRHDATFRIEGVSVTDGICIWQEPVGIRFPEGVMVASDKDQSIAVVDLREIRSILTTGEPFTVRVDAKLFGSTEKTIVVPGVVSSYTGRRECMCCGNPAKALCKNCRTPYCGVKCQTEHWPVHKVHCVSSHGK